MYFLVFFRKFVLFFVIFVVFNSCNKDDLSQLKSIKLNLDNSFSEQPPGNPFYFKTIGDNNKDVTASCQIKVNGNPIDGNLFTPTEEGTFNVQAFYENFESNILIIKTITESDYTKKVLVEDYTGTWCGWCPRVAHAINLCKDQSENVISVAVHISDIFAFDKCNSLKNEFGVIGLPTGKINRIHTWTTNMEHLKLNEVLDKTGANAPLGIALNTEIENNQINTEIKVGFATNFNEQINIVIYLLENGLIKNQTNYTEFFNGYDILIDYEHNDVLREVYTDILGEAIPSAETLKDNIYTKNYNFPIPSSVESIDNLDLVVFVVKNASQEVINSQKVPIGSNVDFE